MADIGAVKGVLGTVRVGVTDKVAIIVENPAGNEDQPVANVINKGRDDNQVAGVAGAGFAGVTFGTGSALNVNTDLTDGAFTPFVESVVYYDDWTALNTAFTAFLALTTPQKRSRVGQKWIVRNAAGQGSDDLRIEDLGGGSFALVPAVAQPAYAVIQHENYPTGEVISVPTGTGVGAGVILGTTGNFAGMAQTDKYPPVAPSAPTYANGVSGNWRAGTLKFDIWIDAELEENVLWFFYLEYQPGGAGDWFQYSKPILSREFQADDGFFRISQSGKHRITATPLDNFRVVAQHDSGSAENMTMFGILWQVDAKGASPS